MFSALKALALTTIIMSQRTYATPKEQLVVVDKPTNPEHDATRIAAAIAKRNRKAVKRLKDMK